MKKQNLLVLTSLLTLGLIAGCSRGNKEASSSVQPSTSQISTDDKTSTGGNDSTSASKPTITVTGVTISGAAETLEAGEELTLTATVTYSSGTDTLGVEWLSSNENVATVDENGKVVALSVAQDTEVTITATSKKDSTKKQSVTIKVLKDENTTLFGDKATIANGDEANSVANAGTLIEWHDQANWCGGVSTITKAESENNGFEIEFTQTEGSAWFGTQVFYKNSSLVAGTAYKLSVKITASVAANITLNGKTVTLVEGENNVVVKYIEDANKASLRLQFGVENLSTVLGINAKVEIIGWEDASDDKVVLSAPTNVAITNGDSQGLYALSFTEVENAAGYMYSIKNASGEAIEALSYKACTNGAIIDLRNYDTAKYLVVVQAIGDGLDYSDSATSEAVEINHEKPEAREAVTYRANYGDEVIDLAFGEAANASTTPTFWNDQNWCGSNCVIDYAMAKGDQIQVKFSGATIDFSFQLFVTQTGVNAGSQYTLKMNIWSDVAGKINLNGQDVTLKVGDNIVAIKYTASSADQYNNPIASGITLKNNEVKAAELKISNIRWTEVIEGIEDEDVGQACEEPEILKAVATKISAPEGVVYNANGTMAWAPVSNASSYKVTVYSDAACTVETTVKDVAIANGGALDLSTLTAGEYYAKLYAVAADGTVSAGSQSVKVTVSEAGISAPVGVVYNSNGTMAWAPVTGADGYVVTVYSDAECTEETTIKDVAIANGGALNTSSLEAGEYYAKVFATKGDKKSDGSSSVKIVIEGTSEGGDTGEEGDDVTPVEPDGEVTVLAKGSSATRVEGAGYWIWIDTTDPVINGTAKVKVDSVDMKDGGGVAVARKVSEAFLSDFTAEYCRLYIIMDGGVGADWTTTINFTITQEDKNYAGSVTYIGEKMKSNSEEEEEEKTPTEIVGTATVIERGLNDTKIEGAGAWIFVDTAALNLTPATFTKDMIEDIQVTMKNDAGVDTNATIRVEAISDWDGNNSCRIYCVLNMAPIDGWTTEITFTIAIDGKGYTATANFSGGTFVAPTEE